MKKRSIAIVASVVLALALAVTFFVATLTTSADVTPVTTVTVGTTALNAGNATMDGASFDATTGTLTLTKNVGDIKADNGKLTIVIDEADVTCGAITMKDAQLEITGSKKLTVNGNITIGNTVAATETVAASDLGFAVTGDVSLKVGNDSSSVALYLNSENNLANSVSILFDTTGTVELYRAKNAVLFAQKAKVIDFALKNGTVIVNTSATGTYSGNNSPLRLGANGVTETVNAVISGGELVINGGAASGDGALLNIDGAQTADLTADTASSFVVCGGKVTINNNNTTNKVEAIRLFNADIVVQSGSLSAATNAVEGSFLVNALNATEVVKAAEGKKLITTNPTATSVVYTAENGPVSTVTIGEGATAVVLDGTNNTAVPGASFDATTGTLTLTDSINADIYAANGKLIVKLDKANMTDEIVGENLVVVGEVEITGKGTLILSNKNNYNNRIISIEHTAEAGDVIGMSVTGQASVKSNEGNGNMVLSIGCNVSTGFTQDAAPAEAYFTVDTEGTVEFTRNGKTVAGFQYGKVQSFNVKKGTVIFTNNDSNANNPLVYMGCKNDTNWYPTESGVVNVTGGKLELNTAGAGAALKLFGSNGNEINVSGGELIAKNAATQEGTINVRGAEINVTESGKITLTASTLKGVVATIGETDVLTVNAKAGDLTLAGLKAAASATLTAGTLASEGGAVVPPPAPVDILAVVTLADGSIAGLPGDAITAGSGTITYADGVITLNNATGIKNIDIKGDMTVKVVGTNAVENAEGNGIQVKDGVLTFVGNGKLNVNAKIGLYATGASEKLGITIAEEVAVDLKGGQGIYVLSSDLASNPTFELKDKATVNALTTSVPLWVQGAIYQDPTEGWKMSDTASLILTSSGTSTFNRDGNNTTVLVEKATNINVTVKNGTYNMKGLVGPRGDNAVLKLVGIDNNKAKLTLVIDDATLNLEAKPTDVGDKTYVSAIRLIGTDESTMTLNNGAVVNITAAYDNEDIGVYGINLNTEKCVITVDGGSTLNINASNKDGKSYAIYSKNANTITLKKGALKMTAGTSVFLNNKYVVEGATVDFKATSVDVTVGAVVTPPATSDVSVVAFASVAVLALVAGALVIVRKKREIA